MQLILQLILQLTQKYIRTIFKGIAAMAMAMTMTMRPGWAQSLPPKPESSCLMGTFIQLAGANISWNQSDWIALFEQFRELQIQNLVIQWSSYDQMALYPSLYMSSTVNPPLTSILDLADHAGMKVMIGLSYDSAYWERLKNTDKLSYLAHRLEKNISLAADLMPMVSQRKSFAGWYISEEVDDITWHSEGDRNILFSYLMQLSTNLHYFQPSAQIGISGFANQGTPVAEIEAFWSKLLVKAPFISRVYFQDGVGVAKLSLNTLASYYQAIKNATDRNQRTLIPVIEAFQQTSGEPMSNGEFAAAPANLTRLLAQIKMSSRYAAHWIAFGVPEYLTPNGGTAAGQLYDAFIKKMHQDNAQCISTP